MVVEGIEITSPPIEYILLCPLHKKCGYFSDGLFEKSSTPTPHRRLEVRHLPPSKYSNTFTILSEVATLSLQPPPLFFQLSEISSAGELCGYFLE